MRGFSSRPHARTPWRDLLLSALAALLAPGLLGAMLTGISRLAEARSPAAPLTGLGDLALALVVSPLLAFAGMILAVPLASFMIRLGWFGWVAAAALGLGVGTAMAVLLHQPVAAPFGLALLLVLRAVLGRLRPIAA